MNSEQALLQKLQISKQIMQKHNNMGRNTVTESLDNKINVDTYEPVKGTYNIPQEYLSEDAVKQKKRGRCKNCYTKRRLFELEKDKLDTLIDEIVLSKKSDSEDIVKKEKFKSDDETPIYKIIKKNLQSIKTIADKEDINLNKLIQILKKGE